MNARSARRRRQHVRIQEKAAAADRRWFAAHPGETFLVRPYVPGEMPPEFSGEFGRTDTMVVEQIAPGMRIRRPMQLWQRGPGSNVLVFGVGENPITARLHAALLGSGADEGAA